MLVKSPWLTVVATLALSVAIGAGATYLEVINDLYRPRLPFPAGDRVVGVRNWDTARQTPDDRALAHFQIWRKSASGIEALSAFRPFERNVISDDGKSEPARGAQISASAIQVTQVAPRSGRWLSVRDEAGNASPVVVLSHSLWRDRFSANPDIIGRWILLGGAPHQVIGVMPEGFAFPINHAFWVPLRMTSDTDAQLPVKVFGRLTEGVDADSAAREIASLNASVSGRRLQPRIQPYVASLTSDTEDVLAKRMLYSFNIFFVLLLCVCGANVATLVFARTATREGEITVRNALGATRARIASQLFAEAFVLTLAAGVIGLLAAGLALRGVEKVIRATAGSIPFWWNATLGSLTIVYAIALVTLAAAIIGLVPAIKATTPRLQVRLRQAAVGGSTVRFGRVWTGVIVGQVAITVLFLCALASLGWNFRVGRYGGAALPFNSNEYVVARVDHDSTANARTLDLLDQKLSAERDVRNVTFGGSIPGMDYPGIAIEVKGGAPVPEGQQGQWIRDGAVASDFLQTFQAKLVAGRLFDAADVGKDVAIVDATFAREVLGGASPIGRQVRQRWNADRSELGPWRTIVGVIEPLSASSEASRAVVYRPVASEQLTPIFAAVHVTRNVDNFAPRMRAIAATVDPRLRLTGITTVQAILDADRRVFAMFFRLGVAITAVALLLATAGVYSLMAFTVAQRTREIGIRVALGAAPRRIVTAIFSRAFKQLVTGVLVGGVPGALILIVGAPEVARGGGLVSGLGRTLGVAAVMLVIGLLACIPPARRALRIQPTEAVKATG